MVPVDRHPLAIQEASPTPLDDTLSRRRFIARSAGLTAILAFGNFACGSREEAYRAMLGPEDRPQNLALREYAVLSAAAKRMIPAEAPHPGAERLGVARRIDRELGFHSREFADDVVSALRLIEWSPLVTHLARFTRLDGERQDEVLASMAGSRFAARRTAFQGIKALVMFFHYTQERAWLATSYDGPWVPRVPPAALA